MEANTIKVKVKTIKNEIYELDVPKNIEIGDFKTEIEKVSGIEKNIIRIIFKGKQLKEGDTLDKFIKNDGETVHLIKGIAQNKPDQPQANTTGTQNAPTNNSQNPTDPNIQNSIPLNNSRNQQQQCILIQVKK